MNNERNGIEEKTLLKNVAKKIYSIKYSISRSEKVNEKKTYLRLSGHEKN